MTDRRYSDAEVTEILRRATVPRPESPSQLAAQDGMTLAQLEAIAKEAGIEPERVVAAAREIDIPEVVARRAVGVPVSVSRSVQLSRKLSDAEWEFLVTRLRETFDAPGKLESQGSLRQWSNGNLRVMLEPGLNGHRVRFTTLSNSAKLRLNIGSALAAGGWGTTLLAAITGSEAMLNAFPLAMITGVIGIGLAVSGQRQVTIWRDERRRQFEALAAELERLTSRG